MSRKLAPIAVLLGTLVAANTAQADRGHHDGRWGRGRTVIPNRGYRVDYRPAYRYDHRVYRTPRYYSVYRPRYAPPALRVEVVRPRHGYFWIGGRYDWRDNAYVWAPGYYQAVQPGQVWIPGRWELQADGYVWIDGYWQNAQAQQVQQQPQQQWVEGHYEWQNGVQVWVDGYWASNSY
jgi:hypothetical protein